ncbi:MAG: DMT family transporter [Candidatus Viridilinea halotolerans]|uniref:DMT family transporter n=1 Tax=Candidatus Viridilinea halotolerans TaxID=2491704 RepID=A0A426TY52_9CHLR|nr:MAG: DMT family transporter [Candidatus Viridilinea halotolerans]
MSYKTDRRAAPSPVVRAAGWMVGALVSFLTMALAGRELAAELSTFQILFFRSLIGVVVLGLLLGRTGWGQLRTSHVRLHLVRNVAHFGGQFAWFYGLAMIPLAEVFALEFTTPLWTALLAALILGERLTLTRIAALTLGMVGLLIILRPGFQVIQPATIGVLVGAMAFAVAHIATKRLARHDSPLSILFYMTIIQLPLALLPTLMSWVLPGVALWPWLLLVGLCALSAHYCVTRALTLADATVVVPMDFLRLPLVALVGALFYQEPIDGLVLLGAAVMMLGIWINVRGERVKNRNRNVTGDPKHV